MNKKILVIGINYFPEVTSTGLYTTEMCEFLAKNGFDISVITGFPYYPEWKIRKEYLNKGKFYYEVVNRIEVFRYRQYVPSKVTAKNRVKHILSFTFGSLINSFKVNKPDVIITIIPPTTTAFLGRLLKKRFHSKLWIHIQDLEIDAAIDTGLLRRDSILTKLALRVEKSLYRSADIVSTISSGMIGKLKDKGVGTNKIVFFPNWADCNFIKPMEKENSFREENGLVDKFVVMYSGNIGEKQDWNGVISLAKKLVNLKDLVFVIVGDGAKRHYVEKILKEVNLQNIKLLPVQPKEKLPKLLASADIHIIPQKATVKDSVMPSKLLGIMASGRPTVAWGNPDTELRKVIEESKGGVFIDTTHNIDYVNSAIMDIYMHREKVVYFGENARNYVTKNFAKSSILNNLKEKIISLANESR